MIAVVARKVSAVMTAEDLDVFCFRYDRGHTIALAANQYADRRDAEMMFMLTDEAPGAARQLLGLGAGEKTKASAQSAPSENRGGGL